MTPEEMLERMAQAALDQDYSGHPNAPLLEDVQEPYEMCIQAALRELVNAHTEGDLIDYHNVGLDVLAITELELTGEDHEE